MAKLMALLQDNNNNSDDTNNNRNGENEAQRDKFSNWPEVIKSINAGYIIKLMILVLPSTKLSSLSHYITQSKCGFEGKKRIPVHQF